MDKTVSPSYSPSQMTYAEAVGFSRFCFRRKRLLSPLPASTSLDQRLKRLGLEPSSQ